jgi:hypothetical protein
MNTLREVDDLLQQQQAENRALSKQLEATPMGTVEWGQLRARLQQSGQAVKNTQERLRRLMQGGQPSLF